MRHNRKSLCWLFGMIVVLCSVGCGGGGGGSNLANPDEQVHYEPEVFKRECRLRTGEGIENYCDLIEANSSRVSIIATEPESFVLVISEDSVSRDVYHVALEKSYLFRGLEDRENPYYISLIYLSSPDTSPSLPTPTARLSGQSERKSVNFYPGGYHFVLSGKNRYVHNRTSEGHVVDYRQVSDDKPSERKELIFSDDTYRELTYRLERNIGRPLETKLNFYTQTDWSDIDWSKLEPEPEPAIEPAPKPAPDNDSDHADEPHDSPSPDRSEGNEDS